MTKKNTFLGAILELTKSEIVLLEAITLVAGFLIGHSNEHAFQWHSFFFSTVGVCCLALASGALNQIQEHQEDSKMERTKKRPIPSGKITIRFASTLVIVLFILGSILLYQVSINVFLLGLLAVISYNGLYTLWWKRKLAYAAIPGAIPGALPILIGYQATVHNLSDPGGYYLFAILFFWQMPHFWVLALKYSNDYDKGGFPTLPVAKGTHVTRFQIMLWCLAYAGIGLLSSLFFPLGIIGLTGSILISAWLLYELYRFLKHPEQKTWLRFFLSVNFSMILYIGLISVDLWSIYLQSRG